MRVGVENASGEWYCFIDADCRQTSTKTLSVTMQYAINNNIDFLSVLPILETRSFWERVLQPVCSAIMVMWFRPEKVNNPKSTAAYANGAFMLMKKETYDSIGGHESIKSVVNEDMHLARRTKQIGKRLFVIQNDNLYVTRMYSNFRQTWNGWSRIFCGCFASFKKIIISTLVLCASSLFPFISLIVSLCGLLVASEEHMASMKYVAIFSAITLLIQQSLMVRFYALSHSQKRYAPTYTLGSFIAFGMLINAMFKLSGKSTITWRGTTYRGSKLESASKQSRSDINA